MLKLLTISALLLGIDLTTVLLVVILKLVFHLKLSESIAIKRQFKSTTFKFSNILINSGSTRTNS
jgi:hypothetical protein